MKKHIIKACAIIAAFCFLLFSESLSVLAIPTGPAGTAFTVTFDSAGGSAVEQITDVAPGSTISEPVQPTKDGYYFEGWYRDEAHTEKWDFSSDTVTGDLTLHARWYYIIIAADVRREAIAGKLRISNFQYSGAGEAPTDIFVPSTLIGYPLTGIGYQAFYQRGLTGVILPDCLQTIDMNAFTGNEALTGVVIPESVNDIELGAFAGCALTEVHLPDGLTMIGSGAFGNNQITNVELPSHLTRIGSEAFYGNQLTEIELPDTVTTIDDYAFAQNRLASVSIPDHVTSIEEGVFYNNALTDVELPDSITSIGENAFKGNQLTRIDLPDSITSIGVSAFESNLLIQLDLPENLTVISWKTFKDNQLTHLDLEGVTSIGSYAFQNNALTGTLVLPSSVQTIDSYVFDGNALTGLTLNDGLQTIGSMSFQNNQITSLRMPDTVTSCGSSAFINNHIETLTLSDHLTALYSSVFQGNPIAGDLVIPDSVTSIDSYAFSGGKITGLTLSQNLQTIGWDAFSGNEISGSLTIPASVESIDNGAFDSNHLSEVTFESGSASINSWAFDSQRPPEGYVSFRGWYQDESHSRSFNFREIEDNSTAYAYYTPLMYSVYFNANGGSAVSWQSVYPNGHAAVPDNPEKYGYVFGGWFQDAALETPWNFESDAVTRSITLYAKWTPDDGSPGSGGDSGGTPPAGNTAPTATNVGISGTAQIGQTLTGEYTFFDAEDDDETGSTYQWYLAEDSSGINTREISGVTARTYVISPDCEYRYIAFSVIPSDGTDTGTAEISGWAGPVQPAGTASGGTQHPSSASNAPPAASVMVNGKGYSAGTVKTQIQNGRTQTTVNVDPGKLDSVLENAGGEAKLTIPVMTGANTASGVLAAQMVKNMASMDADIELKTASASYTLPAAAINLDAVAEQFGKDVPLSDIKVDITISEPSDNTAKIIENAAEADGFSVMVPAVAFTVTCTYGGKTVEVENYSAYAERTIEIPDGVDLNKITTAVVVEEDGPVRHVPTMVTEKDGRYYARIRCLTNSVYTLIYNPVEFPDAQNHWAKNAINDMASRKITTGYEDGIFRPEGNITRAEFAAIIVRALGLKAGDGARAFGDVKASDWYAGYVETAADYGLIAGFSDGTFLPDAVITREQAMVIIERAMAITGIDIALSDEETSSLFSEYTDAAGISGYARKSMAACLKTGVLSGNTDGTLAPRENLTRAEVTVITRRLLIKSGLINPASATTTDAATDYSSAENWLSLPYVIGYSAADDFLIKNPHLKFAQGADDTGVIIPYNTEDVDTWVPGNVALGRGVFHSFDYPFYYYNIRDNAAERAECFLDKR